MNSELARDLAGTALALARRFHAGATMWCVAPSREPDARLMAAEFARPVSTGRALPAFALTVPGSAMPGSAMPESTGPGLTAAVRAAVRPGDILIAIAAADEEPVADLMRRAPAWGARSVWIGSGRRPRAGAADHVLWIGDPDPLTSVTGQFVPLCHLLRELTHACLEHAGLLTEPAECTDEVCITCSDEGRLGEVLTVPATPFEPALVRTATGEEAVDVTLVAPVEPGDLILVHAGSALVRQS